MDSEKWRALGYKDLSEAELETLARIKTQAEQFKELVASLEAVAATDKRWLAIARTHFQEGLMGLRRAVLKPDFF
jgi:hypothetical protein